MERIRVFLARHLRAQMCLSVLAAAALVCLLCGAVTALTALTAGPRQTIGMALFSVVFSGWLLYSGGLQKQRLRTMRTALRAKDTVDAADPENAGGATAGDLAARPSP
ncbi:hypothetical protein ACH4PW_15430 [Streptomyces sp. NPDC017082]|uniref:hypothetical protein n=1 Tax=Streptomyces sp. NPDC017082 TaxID=3364974 RepID=UPI0037951399